jgi:hypothetical protein
MHRHDGLGMSPARAWQAEGAHNHNTLTKQLLASMHLICVLTDFHIFCSASEDPILHDAGCQHASSTHSHSQTMRHTSQTRTLVCDLHRHFNCWHVRSCLIHGRYV